MNPKGIAAVLVFLIGACGLSAAAEGPGEKTPSAIPPEVTLFPLQEVQLLDGPFKGAQDTDKAYLLQLNPDSLLAWMRQTAGLKPKAPHYGGWDTNDAGMIGHYLSACAQMAEATNNPELRRRVDYIVSEMAAIQAANGDGGLYDSDGSRGWFAKIATGQVHSENTTPWYVMHKTLAGLRDAWLLCGCAQARDVLIKLGDWCIAVTSRLTEAQWQEMLGPPGGMGEFGGPHEVLADIYGIAGDVKYLKLAERFRHNIIFDPLARGDASILTGQHANCEIPKFIGYERIYELSGEPVWHTAAVNFWNNVTSEHTWVNGGNSQWEHFFAPAEFPAKLQEGCGPETCNTYNMLKLTQELYTMQPSMHYVDYYERALYNHILPSEAPGGGFVYYTPMRPGHYRVYSRPYDAFWCCVGTGMENHGKYARMIYAAAPGRLCVNLFIPSILTWKEEGLKLRQDTTFPEAQETRFTITTKTPKRLTLSIRYPGWAAAQRPDLQVNGRLVRTNAIPGSYIDLTRLWKSGDKIKLSLPARITTEPLPGSRDYAAFLYGPILLAGPLGTEGLTKVDFYGGGNNSDVTNQLARKSLPVSKFPSLVCAFEGAAAHVVRKPGAALAFHTIGLGKPDDVDLIPFYDLHFQRYAVYWPVKSAEAYQKVQQQRSSEQHDLETVEARTVDRVLIGEANSEQRHHLAGERSRTGPAGAPFTHWRDALGWFSYDMKVLPGEPVSLRCAYFGGDTGRTFDILVDGKVITTEHLTGERPDEFLYINYPIPPELTHGKDHLTVRFQGQAGSLAGGVLDCRVVRRG